MNNLEYELRELMCFINARIEREKEITENALKHLLGPNNDQGHIISEYTGFNTAMFVVRDEIRRRLLEAIALGGECQ